MYSKVFHLSAGKSACDTYKVKCKYSVCRLVSSDACREYCAIGAYDKTFKLSCPPVPFCMPPGTKSHGLITGKGFQLVDDSELYTAVNDFLSATVQTKAKCPSDKYTDNYEAVSEPYSSPKYENDYGTEGYDNGYGSGAGYEAPKAKKTGYDNRKKYPASSTTYKAPAKKTEYAPGYSKTAPKKTPAKKLYQRSPNYEGYGDGDEVYTEAEGYNDESDSYAAPEDYIEETYGEKAYGEEEDYNADVAEYGEADSYDEEYEQSEDGYGDNAYEEADEDYDLGDYDIEGYTDEEAIAKTAVDNNSPAPPAVTDSSAVRIEKHQEGATVVLEETNSIKVLQSRSPGLESTYEDILGTEDEERSSEHGITKRDEETGDASENDEEDGEEGLVDKRENDEDEVSEEDIEKEGIGEEDEEDAIDHHEEEESTAAVQGVVEQGADEEKDEE